MKMATISQVSNLPADEEPISKGKVEKKSGKRFGYNYIFIKSYKESQKNDVVKCLYIKSLTDFGFCVIKEGSYGDTKDKQGRDIIDRLKWQQQLHGDLQNKIYMPRLLGHFEERGNYYLVIEHIRGKSLQKVYAEKKKYLRASIIKGDRLGMKFIDYLIQITDILNILHAQKIVHRDATPNNYMITPRGRVALIDMEMCYSLQLQYPTPAFQLGTYGYMSPQQEATQIPTPAEDIFALGAIILQLWSGVSPGKLTNEPIVELNKKIAFFIPDLLVAEMVISCLLPEDSLRPAAAQIKQVLYQYKMDLKYKVTRSACQPLYFEKEEILTVLQKAIFALASPLLADEKKGWFSNDIKPSSAEEKHKLRKNWYASYNRGATGVIYILAMAKKSGLDIDVNLPFVQLGLDLVKEKYIDRIEHISGGLHFGSDGIAVVISLAIQHGLIDASAQYLEWIDQLLGKKSNAIGMMSGSAGQGLANILCRPFIGSAVARQRLQQYAQLLADKQESDGSWVNGVIKRKHNRKRKKKISRGFAHGMAGYIYFLLELTKQFNNNIDTLEMAEAGLQWLIKKAICKNNIIQWRSSENKELSYGWADGTAGIALTFIKAYEVTGKEVFKKYATGALHSIPPFITDSNISQLQGLSGLGEVYLEAYHVFKEIEWSNRAGWIAQVIMQLKKQHPEYGAYWLVEHERQPVANFMIGCSGVMHFLLRYCYPEKIGFPLMTGR
jgi:serine/threonine protein kinase